MLNSMEHHSKVKQAQVLMRHFLLSDLVQFLWGSMHCRFHHPRERLIPAPNCVLSLLGLPLRPGEPLCIFYSRYGICKFGPNCKFDHPVAAPMGILAYSLSASSSSDVPVVRRLLGGSSSAILALTFSSDGPLEASHGKSRRLPLSDSPQMDSGDENVESE